MEFHHLFVATTRFSVVIGLLLALAATAARTTPSECDDFGLRNIVGDEGDWRIYNFTGHPCLICLDGRRMSSFSSSLILPCLHQEQAAESNVSVHYYVGGNLTKHPLQIKLVLAEQCQTEYDSALQLTTGEPVTLEEGSLSLDISFSLTFLHCSRLVHYLLTPSDNLPRQSVICIRDVNFDNIRLANSDTLGERTSVHPTPLVENRITNAEHAVTTAVMTSHESQNSNRNDFSSGISLVWVITPLCVGIVIGFGCGFFARSRYASCQHRNESKRSGKDGVVLKPTEDMTRERSNRNVTKDNQIYEQVNEDNAATLPENMPNITHAYFQDKEKPRFYSRNIFQSNL